MTDTAQDIFLTEIDEPPFAMRSDIPRDEIFELANDIKKNGLINPITVRPKNGRYEVVAGHRRMLAHRYGGMPAVRCIVRELSDDEAFSIMTSENLARENVNPVDEAAHTKRLFEMRSGDLAGTAAVLNRSTSWVATRLLIADMPDDLKEALRTDKIKMGVALAFSKITHDTDRAAALQMAISQGASIVVANYIVAQWEAGLFGSALERIIADPNALNGERRIVMLRCSVDGKEHPASECVSMIVWSQNTGYIEALRQHLDSVPVVSEVPVGGDSAHPGGER